MNSIINYTASCALEVLLNYGILGSTQVIASYSSRLIDRAVAYYEYRSFRRTPGNAIIISAPLITERVSNNKLTLTLLPQEIVAHIVSYINNRSSAINFLSTNATWRSWSVALLDLRVKIKLFSMNEFVGLKNQYEKNVIFSLNIENTDLSNPVVLKNLWSFIGLSSFNCVNNIKIGNLKREYTVKNARYYENILELLNFISSEKLLPSLTSLSIKCIKDDITIPELPHLQILYCLEIKRFTALDHKKLDNLTRLHLGTADGAFCFHTAKQPKLEELIVGDLYGKQLDFKGFLNLKKIQINKFSINRYGYSTELIFFDAPNKLEVLDLGTGPSARYNDELLIISIPKQDFKFVALKELHIGTDCMFKGFCPELFPLLKLFTCHSDFRARYPNEVALLEAGIQEKTKTS